MHKAILSQQVYLIARPAGIKSHRAWCATAVGLCECLLSLHSESQSNKGPLRLLKAERQHA